MDAKNNEINRRNFLKTVGAAGLSSVLVSRAVKADPNDPNEPNAAGKTQEPVVPQVPKRKFGKEEVEVSCLGIGVMFNLLDNQLLLRNALKYGVTYLDTADSYAQGNSELGIGEYLKKNPEGRKNLFIVSKASRTKTIDDIEQCLQASLKRMNTDYIDAYFTLHGISNPAQLTDDMKKWVESAKKRKLIRYFGFSTHSNMARFLSAAAQLDWIDLIMTTYNFRLMKDAAMQAAMDACHKAKIGLVAMKATGRASRRRQGEATEDDPDKKLLEQLMQRGFTLEQAAIKIVLEDQRICCACVGMETVPKLAANIAAVLDKTELTLEDRNALNEYAGATCTVIVRAVPISATLPCLRYLMSVTLCGI